DPGVSRRRRADARRPLPARGIRLPRRAPSEARTRDHGRPGQCPHMPGMPEQDALGGRRMNRRPPLWYRVASRPSWSRGDPYKVTDYDPGAAMNIALNRVEIAMAHREARMLK